MITVEEEIIRDMDSVREILSKTEHSIVVIKNGDVLTKKKGEGIRPILEAIDELKENMNDSVIGDRILGKASALLCAYAKCKGVYSPQATKKASSLRKSGKLVRTVKIGAKYAVYIR